MDKNIMLVSTIKINWESAYGNGACPHSMYQALAWGQSDLPRPHPSQSLGTRLVLGLPELHNIHRQLRSRHRRSGSSLLFLRYYINIYSRKLMMCARLVFRHYIYPFRAQIVAKLQRFCMDRNSAK